VWSLIEETSRSSKVLNLILGGQGGEGPKGNQYGYLRWKKKKQGVDLSPMEEKEKM